MSEEEVRVLKKKLEMSVDLNYLVIDFLIEKKMISDEEKREFERHLGKIEKKYDYKHS